MTTKEKNQEQYDIKSSKEIARAIFKGEYEEYELQETLYQNEDGEFFLYRDYAGEWSMANLVRLNRVCQNGIEPISEEEVKEWLLSTSNEEAYKSLFGKNIPKPANKKILYFRLIGTMQFWPDPSCLQSSTSRWPTKSGICEHIIGRAMGLSIDDDGIAEICQKIELGVKQTNSIKPIFTDYQPSKHDAMNVCVEYLNDAKFLVAISCDDELLQRIYEALRNPKYPMYLGDPCCTPSSPIIPYFTDDYTSIEDALKHIPLVEETEKVFEVNNHPCVSEIIQYDSKYGDCRNDVRDTSVDCETDCLIYTSRYVVTKLVN